MNFSVLDWNIQGTKYYTSTNFSKISPLLKNINADIFCLQEAEELLKQLATFNQLKFFNSSWFLTRGIKILKVDLGNYISDHRAIFVECSIN